MYMFMIFKSTYITYKVQRMYNYHSVTCYRLLTVYKD
jgi:hypothetical protein